ncbi:MAG: T9SS type A sorting domain-containing protein [Flavobacteriales bacterium]|nr:T9SS type A sorting domain-containing protein [Flavobacteriales bacterium]
MKKLSIISTIILLILLGVKEIHAQQVKCRYVQLDGTDDYLISDTSASYHTTSYTIETWFKFNSVGTGWKFLASTMSAGSGSRYTYYDYSAQRFVLGLRSGGFQDYYFNYALDTNWHHMAYVYDQPNAMIKGYVDGVLIDSATTTGAVADTQPTQMVVGRAPGSPSNVSDCNFEEVRYWNTARTQQEINAAMNMELTGSEANLIGYWNMDHSNSTVASDLSVIQNPLLLTNGDSSAVWINECQFPVNASQSSTALDLNGSGAMVSVPGSAAADLSQGSWGAWVKIDAFGSAYQRIIYKESFLELFYFEGAKRFEAEVVVNGVRYEVYTDSITFPIDTAQWYHLMVTYDTNDFKIYVDGNLKSTNSAPQGPIDSQPNQWGIGASPSSGAWSFNGDIDEVVLFNRALTAGEIQGMICNQIETVDPIYSDLVAYYKMDDSTGIVATDEIFATNGTLNAGAGWITPGMPYFKPQVLVNANVLTSSLTGSGYQWYLNGSPIAGATQVSYTATVSGNYQVEVLSEFGCLGISDMEVVVISGVEDVVMSAGQTVYPNPSNGIVNISSPETLAAVQFIDLSGRLVYETSQATAIDISSLSPGIYFVKTITKSNKQSIHKLVRR